MLDHVLDRRRSARHLGGAVLRSEPWPTRRPRGAHPHPRRRRRVRRACTPLCGCRSGCAGAPGQEGRGHRRRPAVVHDLPAVPPRGRRRQRGAPARGRPAAPGAEQVRGPHRPGRLGRPRAPGGPHPPGPRRGVRPVLRGHRAGTRIDRADAADPGPRRAGHRLQAGRGGHRPAQHDARQARHRHDRHRPRGAPHAADVRLRRRRLRRHRGAGRARGHDHLRHPLLPGPVEGRHPVRARRGGGPDPARGGRGPRPVHRRAAAAAEDRRTARHPAGVLRRRPHRALRRRGVRRRDDRLDRGCQGQPDAREHRPAARRQGSAEVPRRPARRGRRRTPGRPATARRCRT